MSGFTESFGQRFKNEIEKLKPMKWKEKCGYIWEYYKFPFLVTLVLAVLFGSLINTWFINPPKKVRFGVAWMSHYEPDANLTALGLTLTDILTEDPEREEVTVTSFLESGEVSYDMAMVNRLMAMMAAGEIDVFLTNLTTLSDLAGGYITPLDPLLAVLAEQEPALYERIAPAVTEVSYLPDGGGGPQTRAFGVSLRGSSLFKALEIDDRNLYLSVVVSTKKQEDIIRLLRAVYA